MKATVHGRFWKVHPPGYGPVCAHQTCRYTLRDYVTESWAVTDPRFQWTPRSVWTNDESRRVEDPFRCLSLVTLFYSSYLKSTATRGVTRALFRFSSFTDVARDEIQLPSPFRRDSTPVDLSLWTYRSSSTVPYEVLPHEVRPPCCPRFGTPSLFESVTPTSPSHSSSSPVSPLTVGSELPQT